mgnify:CR=1 FL=1
MMILPAGIMLMPKKAGMTWIIHQCHLKKIAQEIVQFFPCQLVRIIIYDFQS